MEKPCENTARRRVQVLLDHRPDLLLGGVGHEHLDDGPAPDGFLDINSVLPGTQPSRRARSQSRGKAGDWPMMTLNPLSFRFSAWAGPWTP